MKGRAVAIAVAVICPFVGAQARAEEVRRLWARDAPTRNEYGNYTIAAVIVRTDPLGNVYVTGVGGYSSTFQTIKYDRDGNQLWTRFAFANALPHAMEVDAAGNVYVTGSGYNPAYYDVLTVKYDTDGNVLWTAAYDNGTGKSDLASYLSVDDQGNAYVAGYTLSNGAYDFLVIKYGPSGVKLWSATYNAGSFVDSTGRVQESNDIANTLALDPSGNVYVVGGTTVQGAVMIKYDPDGNRQWVKSAPDVAGDGDSWPIRITLDADGNIYLGGTSGYDFIVRKFTTNADDLWTRRFSSTTDIFCDMAVSRAGNLYVVGRTGTDTSSYDVGVVKYDADGNELWSRILGYTGSAWATAMAVDRDDSVYIASHYGTIKYDAAGTLAWTMGGALGDSPLGVAVDSGYSVVVAGFGFGGTYWPSMITEKYSQPAHDAPPVAVAGPDQVVECAGPQGATVTLDGSGSTDPDGDTLTYVWREGAALLGTGRTLAASLALGAHVITLTVDDGRGGSSTDGASIAIRDTAPPTTVLDRIDGTTGADGWYLSPVTLDLAATDTCSGVTELRWASNGGVETVVPGAAASLALTADEIYALTFHAVDQALNAEAPQPLTVKVDAAGPLPAPPVLSGTAGDGGWWRSPVDVSLSAADATSGVAHLDWAVDGGPAQTAPGAAAIVRVGAGTTTVSWTATDVAGNATAGQPVTVRVDDVAPGASVSVQPTTLKPNGQLQPVNVTAGATDVGSGLASLVVKVTNASGALVATVAPGATVQLRGTKGQRYTFTANAIDVAGNVGTSTAVVQVK